MEMIRSGCFADVDVAMMVHPCPADLVYATFLAIRPVTVTYKGVSSHASGSPERGINALDAVVSAYNAVSAMRQQFKQSWRAHGIISKGGDKPNIIPDETECIFYARAPNAQELEELQQKLTRCFEGAAVSTGCSVEIEWDRNPYSNLCTNATLAELYKGNARTLGKNFRPPEVEMTIPSGSTDMGNGRYASKRTIDFHSSFLRAVVQFPTWSRRSIRCSPYQRELGTITQDSPQQPGRKARTSRRSSPASRWP